MLPGGARVVFTDRTQGDLGHGGAYVHEVRPDVEARRRAVIDRPWTWLRQVHGGDVVVVERAGAMCGERADAAVTRAPEAALAILTADCAPVAMASPEGVIGAVHCGWRGLEAGVLEGTAQTMRRLGASEVRAVLGPCIRAGCYEFAEADIERLTTRLGDAVRSRTTAGRLALDLPEGVRAVLARADVEVVGDVGACTACSGEHFSHRARAERQRQAMVVWKE